MENKRILVGLMIVLVWFGLCGCGIINSTAKKAAKEYIEDKTVVTPLAKDAAEELGVRIRVKI